MVKLSLLLCMLVSMPAFASNKCVWFQTFVPKTSFEKTIFIERIKQDIRNSDKKVKFDKSTERDLLKIAKQIYCEG